MLIVKSCLLHVDVYMSRVVYCMLTFTCRMYQVCLYVSVYVFIYLCMVCVCVVYIHIIYIYIYILLYVLNAH